MGYILSLQQSWKLTGAWTGGFWKTTFLLEDPLSTSMIVGKRVVGYGHISATVADHAHIGGVYHLPFESIGMPHSSRAAWGWLHRFATHYPLDSSHPSVSFLGWFGSTGLFLFIYFMPSIHHGHPSDVTNRTPMVTTQE